MGPSGYALIQLFIQDETKAARRRQHNKRRWHLNANLNKLFRVQPAKNGILLIDKPAGITSAKAVAAVKRLTGSKKTGHAGTLDPMATGLLICCLNQATKLARFLLEGEKTYSAVLHLGIKTDSQDATGRILSRQDASYITETEVKKTMSAFTGPIQQQPPAYSAVKYRGKPLYHWARNGKPVAKPPRTVVISSLEIQKIALPKVYFSVTCSAGTYIRTLCADVGDSLGCGGHLMSLRRTASCGFMAAQALDLEQLETLTDTDGWKIRLIPPVDALPGMPAHQADSTLRDKIKFGQTIGPSDGIKIRAEKMKIVDADRTLLAIIDQEIQDIVVCFRMAFNAHILA